MIEYYNMKKHNEKYMKEIMDAVERVFKSGRMILSEEVKGFEKEFAEFLGVEYTSAVSTGVDAITLGLLASGIQKSDKIITTALTAYPTICGIINAGAIPVVVDISEDDLCIDPRCIERVLRDNSNIKGVIPVHLYGHCCDMARIMKICGDHNVMVFEDCAQAHGTDYYGKKVGTFGVFSAFSFYPTKNLGACGEGGLISTNNKEIYEKVCELRNYGQSKKYVHNINGYNCRFDELKAAVLREKLKHLEKWNERRIDIASLYIEKLKNIEKIKLIETKDYCGNVFHIFPILAKKRDELRDFLLKENIFTEIHYPIPVNKQKAFEKYYDKNIKTPIADKLTKELLSLPIYPEIENNEIEKVCEKIKEFYEKF